MSPQLAALILIVVGALALLLGKRLFWLFAGIVGFAVGWWLTGLLLPKSTDPLIHIIIGVIAGLILAGLSRFLGTWAIRLVAAVAGFVILPLVLSNLGMMSGTPEPVWAIIGAVLGLIFAWIAAGWALIVISSILGAALIVEGMGTLMSAPLSEAVQLIIGVVLMVFGIIVQSRQKG